jgi:GTP cyclohydrolase III
MKSLSQLKKETADELEQKIKSIETTLIYSARFKKKVDVSFMDLISATEAFLDITKPVEKYPNTNKNQF